MAVGFTAEARRTRRQRRALCIAISQLLAFLTLFLAMSLAPFPPICRLNRFVVAPQRGACGGFAAQMCRWAPPSGTRLIPLSRGSAASVAGGSPVLGLIAGNCLSLPTRAVAAQPQIEAQLNSGAKPSGTGGGEAAQTWHVNKSGIQKCPNGAAPQRGAMLLS